MESPLGGLERALIEDFVRGRGYDPHKLHEIAHDERDALLRQASLYASGRLVEVEARSHYLDDVHARVPGSHKTGLD
jgi:hypothetical protein